MSKKILFFVPIISMIISVLFSGISSQINNTAKESSAISQEATVTGIANTYDCTVNGIKGYKVGTSKNAGSLQITVPSGAKLLSFFVAAWNNAIDPVLSITNSDKIYPSSINLKTDKGFNNNTPFTLANDEDEYCYEFVLNNITETTDFLLTSPKRFIVWDAVYDDTGYSLHFDANNPDYNHSRPRDIHTTNSGTIVTLPEALSCIGYDFIGWSESPDDNQATIYDPLSDFVLIAIPLYMVDGK